MERDKQRIHYQAIVPANTTAALSLPTGFKIRKVILGSGETTVELLKKRIMFIIYLQDAIVWNL